MDESSGMKLNYDIFLLVSHMMTELRPPRVRDVSVVSRTCRRLHRDCTPLLLGPRDISLLTEWHIRSFCQFMLSDPSRRFPLLSRCPALEFSADPLPEPVADLLIEMLRCIIALPCLRFLSIEETMFAPPRVLPAFASLTCIQSLDIRIFEFLGKFSYVQLLKTTLSPLKAVALHLPHHEDKDMQHMTYNRDLDPLWLFSSLSSTLESMCLFGRTTVDACSVIHVYPRLTHLTIHRHCMPIVRPFINAFPALRFLYFNYVFFWEHSLGPEFNLQELPLRGKSPQDLRRYNREDQLVHGSWPGLEYFMANTLDAYRVAFTCHIPSLHLLVYGGNAEAEISAICAVFADIRPSAFRLTLRPRYTDYIPAIFDRRIDLFSSLSSLELRLDVEQAPFDFKSYFENVGTALQHLSIISLQVEIKCLVYLTPLRSLDEQPTCDHPGRWGTVKDARCYTLDALSGEDMEGHIRYFLRTIGTLRRMTMAWGRCWVDVAHRFVSVDLDNIPHNVDRPGRPTDAYWEDGY